MTTPLQITQEGLDKLRRELQELKTVRRPELAVRLAAAKELGDLSENADYQTAKEELAWVEGRVNELEHLISRAIVAQAPMGGTVAIGSSVTANYNGLSRVFIVVGATEADPSHGKISVESPLGGALLGCKVGDTVLVQTPSGPIQYEVVKIA